MQNKIICPKCKGNGYISIKIQNEKDPLIEDCKYCNNQGELTEKEINKKMDYARMQQ
jgi:hypothetical protein